MAVRWWMPFSSRLIGILRVGSGSCSPDKACGGRRAGALPRQLVRVERTKEARLVVVRSQSRLPRLVTFGWKRLAGVSMLTHEQNRNEADAVGQADVRQRSRRMARCGPGAVA